MRGRRAVVTLLLAACVGCALPEGEGDAGASPDDLIRDRQDFPLELGTGEVDFVVLDEGAGLLLVRGFQGLQHVAASVRAWDIPEERYPVSVELFRVEDGEQVSEPASTRVPLRASDDGYVEIVGLRAVVEDPAAIVGQQARLRVEVTGPDGLMASASHVGVVQWAAEAP